VKSCPHILSAFPLKYSLRNGNLGFRILYLELRETAEFRDY